MNKVRSYDLETGKVVWESAGLTMNAIPSPVHDDGMVFLISGFRGNDLQGDPARRGEGRHHRHAARSSGRSTATRRTCRRRSSTTASSTSSRGTTGILSAFDAKTGKPHYQLQRLEGVPNVFASPVGAAGRVYIAGRRGRRS